MANLDEELKNMEEAIRRLKIEYHVFFNGNRKKPPEDIRLRLDRQAKQLSDRGDMTAAQRFRYTTLLTRYYSYRSLWRRMLQEKEKGKEPKSEQATLSANQSPGAGQSTERFRISITDPKAEEEKVRSLYDELTRLKQEENSEESPVPFPQFVKYIAAQTHDIRNKYGCVSVAYIITMEEGAIRFTAAAENP